jgi:hypothetical protein
MRTFGSGTESYLYLNGLATDRSVRLSDTVELLPARAQCSADLFLNLGKSDVDISVISLFLPLVQCQLKVRGDDARDTAVRTWNAVWDALLLGAITNSDVMCNLQSDVPAEQLTITSTVGVTNYHLRGLSAGPGRSLSEAEIAWIERHFAAARSLLDDDSFQNAIHCLATYHWHSLPRARLAILWSGIEGLFGVESEIVFRVSLYVARFLASDDRLKQAELFAKVKELYKLRSKAVHGGRIKSDPQEGVHESAELLRSLVTKCVESGALPHTESLVP